MPVRRLLLAAVLGALALSLLLGASVGLAGAPRASGPIYRNRSYSPAERAADLVARMTLAEKASQMVSSQAPAIPRLGIKAWGWWNEANHGVAFLQLHPGYNNNVVNTMSYPVDLALGSSWDPSLMYTEASAISDEAREVAPQNFLDLDFFAPTVNLARDPRWGRNDETFSEDPMLTAAMASQYVDGFQGETPQGHLLPEGGGYLKAIATLKHYAANNTEATRMTGSSNVGEATLRDYYTNQFKQIISASHPGAMMTAFNSINGTPASANVYLMKTLARQTFGFGGYFTSDCDSVDDIISGHNWRPPDYTRAASETESRAIANASGEDLNCELPYVPFNYQNTLPAATLEGIRTQTGKYNVNDTDTSLVRLFTARMELGEFGNVNSEPWVRQARAQLGGAHWVNSNANNAITETPSRLGLDRAVADRTLVLLKNNASRRQNGTVGPVLPLQVPSSGTFKVAVIGYFGNTNYPGGYSSYQSAAGSTKVVTPYGGIKAAIQAINPGAEVDYFRGFAGGNSASGLTNIDPSAVAAVGAYNDVIVVVGTDNTTSSEGRDRSSLALPGLQGQLISEVAAKNPNTVAALETVGDVNVGSFWGSVPAVLWSSYNGQLVGNSLADVLLGKYDPSGHLPFTWYANDSELPPIGDYRIRPGAGTRGRTYMYFSGPVSFPFGYGLSYTSFRTSNLRFDRTHLNPNETLHASVTVTNTGSVPGEDLVQLYVEKAGSRSSDQPIKRLEGFEQVELAPGQSRTATLPVKILNLAVWNAGREKVDDGLYDVQIGSSADGVLLQRDVSVAGPLDLMPSTVTASPVMPGDSARGIQSRVMFPDGTVVDPRLTVSMNDEAMFGYVSAGHGRGLPAGVRVRYASNRPGVVSVTKGTIRTVSNGAATITATVTYHGASASTQFVVRVLSELSGITLKLPAKTQKTKTKHGSSAPTSVALPGFQPDTYVYDVIVPQNGHLPRIGATTPDKRARVRVGQPSHVPGAARVRITGLDGITLTYTLYFAHPAQGDPFSGTDVGSQWKWVRHDPAAVQVSHGSLFITAEQGDLSGTTSPGRNLLVQPALGNWTIQSKLTFSSAPHLPTQQAGIIAYQDDQNYLKLDWEYSPGGPRLVETTEDNLSGAPVGQVLASFPTGRRVGNTVWLRMVKRGPRYATYYSANGRSWVPIYGIGASLTNVEVGLFAWGGATPLNDLRVAFAYFHVRNTGAVNLGSLH